MFCPCSSAPFQLHLVAFLCWKKTKNESTSNNSKKNKNIKHWMHSCFHLKNRWDAPKTSKRTRGDATPTFRGVRAQDLTPEWKQGPSVRCLIKCARPRPIGEIQAVPSYFPATDCRWQSIESLKGSPYSGCLLIRLKGRVEPRTTWKGIQDEGRWCEIS